MSQRVRFISMPVSGQGIFAFILRAVPSISRTSMRVILKYKRRLCSKILLKRPEAALYKSIYARGLNINTGVKKTGIRVRGGKNAELVIKFY